MKLTLQRDRKVPYDHYTDTYLVKLHGYYGQYEYAETVEMHLSTEEEAISVVTFWTYLKSITDTRIIKAEETGQIIRDFADKYPEVFAHLNLFTDDAVGPPEPDYVNYEETFDGENYDSYAYIDWDYYYSDVEEAWDDNHLLRPHYHRGEYMKISLIEVITWDENLVEWQVKITEE